MTVGQLKDVVVKALTDYPQTRHGDATLVTLAPLVHTWRCPEKTPAPAAPPE